MHRVRVSSLKQSTSIMQLHWLYCDCLTATKITTRPSYLWEKCSQTIQRSICHQLAVLLHLLWMVRLLTTCLHTESRSTGVDLHRPAAASASSAVKSTGVRRMAAVPVGRLVDVRAPPSANRKKRRRQCRLYRWCRSPVSVALSTTSKMNLRRYILRRRQHLHRVHQAFVSVNVCTYILLLRNLLTSRAADQRVVMTICHTKPIRQPMLLLTKQVSLILTVSSLVHRNAVLFTFRPVVKCSVRSQDDRSMQRPSTALSLAVSCPVCLPASRYS